ncbi:hypothetical protein [Pseudobutyrivibrio xylanivorans]|jgi:hypothetical protein|uniref:Type VII secretion effector, SACOL2603 family n=1 Tax=Pseudobutyrivibrio xylanivorans DSM 14809 TaxID=1123012 RepID=A0A1M6KQG2_PSEXY|nr:hypothetical protein [Pseudobutyrivibrio xylanivorans]SHJ61152.1 hypothetical protein SAMN02745725_02915 [Pseudobutyrivibrio xylanivorans DSM 14809]
MAIVKTALDTIEYERVVREIKTENDEILNGFSALSEADPAIKNNSIIPQFIKADSDVINMLTKLKQQIGVVINTMETFESKIVEANQDATDSGNQLV